MKRYLSITLVIVTASCAATCATPPRVSSPEAGLSLLRDFAAAVNLLKGGGGPERINEELALVSATLLDERQALDTKFRVRFEHLFKLSVRVVYLMGDPDDNPPPKLIAAAEQFAKDVDVKLDLSPLDIEGVRLPRPTDLNVLGPAIEAEVVNLHLLLDPTTSRSKAMALYFPKP